MTMLAIVLLVAATVLYVFYPERQVAAQSQKTRLEYLREHKITIYDNLRDLNFEYRAGKYPEEDYAGQRAQLENEAAVVLAEIELLERTSADRLG